MITGITMRSAHCRGLPIRCGRRDTRVRSACKEFADACGCCRQPPAQESQMARRSASIRTIAVAYLLPSISTTNTPVHVIQALLGHATIDTVMVYAKLYPQTMVEEYRKAVRGLYIAFHGEESLRNPTAEEWATFSVSCSMRDMGTHLCALPTGEHCELAAARGRSEPAGQLAARNLK